LKTVRSVKLIQGILVIWYLVGIAGFLVQPLRPLFQLLTPFGMLMAAILLIYFHEPADLKSYLAFSGIAVVGFVVELIGVNTQLLFGSYHYGPTLGPKLWDTPFVIGINWLVLIYCISAITAGIRNTWYFPLTGAMLMVFFDWVMEPVAVATDMWYWMDNAIPLKNYMDWFLISGILFLMIRIFKIEIRNKIAGILLLMQFIFFLSLNLLYRI